MLFEKLFRKLTRKNFAVFFDENGKQIETIRIPIDSNKFRYKGKRYFCDSRMYTKLELNSALVTRLYWFYDMRYSEPLYYSPDYLAKADNGQPYIAEQIQTLLETKILQDINRKKSPLLNLDLKTIMMILAGLGVGVYLLMGGQLGV